MSETEAAVSRVVIGNGTAVDGGLSDEELKQAVIDLRTVYNQKMLAEEIHRQHLEAVKKAGIKGKVGQEWVDAVVKADADGVLPFQFSFSAALTKLALDMMAQVRKEVEGKRIEKHHLDAALHAAEVFEKAGEMARGGE